MFIQRNGAIELNLGDLAKIFKGICGYRYCAGYFSLSRGGQHAMLYIWGFRS